MTPPRLTTDSPAVPAASTVPEPITGATTRVRTQALLRRGVDEIRILSASRFLGILEEMVRTTLTERLDAEKSRTGHGGEASRSDAAQVLQERWTALRAAHQQDLERIETRLGKLSRAFQQVAGTLSSLGQAHENRPSARS